PFFLYLAYTAPHSPIQPTPEFLAKVKQRLPQLSEKRAKLVALIEQMDDGIGKIVKTLKDDGLYDNTLIFFVSDNGGQLQEGANNGPLRDGKGSMYEGGLKIPGFAVWPNQIKAGSQSSEKLLLMDIYPTIAEIAGVPVKQKIDGISFLPVLKKSDEKMPARPLFFSRREGFGFMGKTSQAVVNGDMKLLQNGPFLPLELYDLRQDPLEQTNLIDKQNQQKQLLQRLLMLQIQKAGSVPWQKPQDK
ncbi:MAG TPA: sulfatase-like hydrolase/transferase, partial [Chitinophagaceae bacterium]